MEKIFIAWGGNYTLAERVAKRLIKYKLDVIIGGGKQETMFLGEQIINQMNSCNQAIILAQNFNRKGFKPNLMFEWGYLVSHLQHKDIAVALIDEEREKLPSDLLGIWCDCYKTKEIAKFSTKKDLTEDKIEEELAKRIATDFWNNKTKTKTKTNKVEILSRWKEIKGCLLDINKYTEKEKIEYIFFSATASYYQYESKWMLEKLQQVSGNGLVDKVVDVIKAYLILLTETNYLLEPLPFRTARALSTTFRGLNDIEPDTEMAIWLKIRSYDLECLTKLKLAQKQDEERDADAIDTYKESIKAGEEAIKLIDELISEEDEANYHYSLLMRAYVYRNMSMAYKSIMSENNEIYYNLAGELAKKSQKARYAFFVYYKQHYPHDLVLVDKFEQEYYLSKLECASFETDEREKRDTVKEIMEYLKEWEISDKKRQMLIEKIKAELKNF